MVICGVCFKKENRWLLQKIGVKDSKKLSPNTRNELANIIKTKCHSYKVIIVDPKEIDDRKIQRLSLNRLEVFKFAEIINHLKPYSIIVDAADVDEERFGLSIKTLLNYSPNQIISKHKADERFPIVSAGSIIAKVVRDDLIEELKIKYGDFGSGYPSDAKTIVFLRNWIKKRKEPPFFVRKTWETTKKILNEMVYTKKITDYFSQNSF